MEIQACCPYCVDRKGTPDSERHLYYNTEKTIYHCFRCGAGGKGIPNGVDISSCAPYKTVKRLTSFDLSPGTKSLSSLLEDSHNEESITLQAAKQYLVRHGLDPLPTAITYRLLISGAWLIFPVYNREKVIFYQKRYLFGKRFWNPPIQSKPLFWAGNESLNSVVVVESYMNALRIAPYTRSVCVFGKSINDNLAEEISSRVKRVVLMLDEGTLGPAFRMKRILSRNGIENISIVDLPAGDVCDLREHELVEYSKYF